jgi:serine phosphatase RsbU (regulator of sigma subunit)
VKKSIKILILDDSEEDIKKVTKSLVNDGFLSPIMSCTNKDSFLIQLEEFQPDVVIVEHTIPNYNTFKALDDARRIIPDVIFILVTDDVPEEFALELIKEGIDDYVFKNHLVRLPFAIENAQMKREFINETKKLASMNKELTSANCEIAEKNKSMTQSIVFAQRIQSIILPKLDVLLNDFKEAFILYKPKDIVSGDFYWFNKKGNEFMVATADCTGHGVPGALLSIIGTNFLNEIAEDKNNFTHPSDILSLLDLNLTSLLKQDKATGYQDGIDIAFVTIDKTLKRIYFSGCKRPLLVYTRHDQKIVEYKGEPYLIGGVEERVKKTFATQEIPYRVGDVIYMFSDGVVDQFGGSKNKKLMRQNFIDMLMSFKHLGLPYQGELLEQKLKTWQGNEPQTDDIIVIGIKL